ncbi:MAG: DUF5011 domain-containing protein [Bacteroidetes bacterium]|nr:DUF5011 domain-containing protein [Bacteroidota bacterium]
MMHVKKQTVALLMMPLALLLSCAKQANPEVIVNGDEQMTIYVGETFNDPGATATDYKGRDITDDIVVFGSVGAESGTYTLGYNVHDKKGNSSTGERVVSRGFKNTNLAGTCSVEQYTNNGGGTQIYSATITAGTGDIVSVTLDNSNSFTAPVVMNATISATGTQINISDQSSNGNTITLGSNGFLDNSDGPVTIHITFQTFNGTMTYNHDATWTKQ